MISAHTKESLLAFRARVEAAWLAGQIRAPVHFPGGNEEQLLTVFRDVRPEDWVCSNWRSMYHALLKGVPEDEVYRQVFEGRSMYLSNREHRFLSSSIVGGMLPTALGLAMGIKRNREDADGFCRVCRWPADRPNKCRCKTGTVWAFVGDMTAETGLYHEFVRYVEGHRLPVRVVVEDNGLSTNTPTQATWGRIDPYGLSRVQRYWYTRTRPHVGLERRVEF